MTASMAGRGGGGSQRDGSLTATPPMVANHSVPSRFFQAAGEPPQHSRLTIPSAAP